MADLGRAALVVSLGLALYAACAGTYAALEKRRRLADSARNALIACFCSTAIAAIVLALALVHHDFSYVYVASHTSRDLSTIYALSAFWGGQEGSLLLWLLVLSGYGALAVVVTRRWTIAAWMFLGFGQILGSHWAYVEVGWAGFYAWDPVENAALMPWLAATAFLHSVMIQERKGMLRVWNMVLVALAFELAIFGDFLTRSGVINSIHSFAQSSIGAWFLGFVVATTLFSVALIVWRLPLLRARTKLESPLSREATFLYNNLLLVALCLTVLWGVIFPILTELFLGESRTIGRPYYDFFLRIFGLPLLFLMGIGPLIAWRRASVRALVKTLRWPIAAALVAGGALIAAGAGSSRPGLIAYTFSAFVLATIVVELVRGTRATGSLFQLIARNRRRYGGYVLHAAIVL